MSSIPVRDLRNHSADVLSRVTRGETLTVTRDGEPVACVTPLRRRPLSTEQLIERRRGLPAVDARAFRADVDELLDPSL